MLKIVDYLDLAIPHLSPALVPTPSLAMMRPVAEAFPAALTRCFGIECRLGDRATTADFAFSITPSERDIFFGDQNQRGFDPSLLQHPLWKRIVEFLRVWADPASALHTNVLQTSVEFDLDGAGDPLHRPGFFFGSKEIPPARPGPSHHFNWLYQTALPMIAGVDLPRPVEENLQRCIACLPPGGYVFALGAFSAREIPHLRICVSGISSDHIAAYLQEIGYPASLTEIREMVTVLSPLAHMDLALDLGEGIGAKMGFECWHDDSSPIDLPRKEAAFFDYLLGAGLCTAEEREALLGFPGFMDSRAALPQHWFDVSQPDGGEPHPGSVSTIRRDVSHIKLVFQPGMPVSAKAYLQMVHEWLPPTLATRHALVYMAREKQTAHLLASRAIHQTPAAGKEDIL